MADTPFIAGWAGYCQLKAGAAATMNLPLRQGTSYARADNSATEQLAQGNALNAWAVNTIPGVSTTQYGILTRAFSGWFNTVNLNALLGLPRDSNGDIAEVDINYRHGADTRTDKGKLARMRIAANFATTDALDVQMQILGRDATSAATFGTYAAQLGAPYNWSDLALQFTPTSGSAVTPYGVEGIVVDLFTQANYRANSTLMKINPGTLLGAVSIQQTCGADTANRMDQFTSGLLNIQVDATINIDLQIKRTAIGKPTTVNGEAYQQTSWRIESVDGDAPVAVSDV